MYRLYNEKEKNRIVTNIWRIVGLQSSETKANFKNITFFYAFPSEKCATESQIKIIQSIDLEWVKRVKLCTTKSVFITIISVVLYTRCVRKNNSSKLYIIIILLCVIKPYLYSHPLQYYNMFLKQNTYFVFIKQYLYYNTMLVHYLSKKNMLLV